jgi:outer membrane lipoprotein-sorting protein
MSFFSRLSRYRTGFVLLLVLPLTGCLFRSRKVQQPIDIVQLKTATQQELIDYINAQAAAIQTMQATVDIDTTVGGVQKGKVTDYQEIRGYVLVRKPAMLRMIGLMPIVRNKAFDMVSDGHEFKLWIPTKNRFVEGLNDVSTHNPAQPMENIRPQHIYDALLLRRIDPDNEIAVLESDTETVADAKNHKASVAEYVIDVIHKGKTGWSLSRKVIFNRTDLLPYRQLLYDTEGNVATNAVYGNYKDESGVRFPRQIEIARPQEEYDITLNIVKLDLNQPLADDKFVLEEPAGAETVYLDKPGTHPPPVPPSDHSK